MLEGFLISVAIFLIGFFLLILKSAIWVIGIILLLAFIGWIFDESNEESSKKAIKKLVEEAKKINS